MKIIILLIILFGYGHITPVEAAEYGIAITYTPVLNTNKFSSIFGGASRANLKTDNCNQVRELEYIAMPGTVFRILAKHISGTEHIYQVQTDDYKTPPNVRLYVDSRFLKKAAVLTSRKPSLPPRETIISTLKASVGIPYVWGGNVKSGVPELINWFYKNISSADKERLTLAGFDCSGLLYDATAGSTPRNTSELVGYGQAVHVANKNSSEIALLLQPLDLIAWKGHVVIVLDQNNTIESRLECGKPGNGGVVMTPLSQRIAEIMRTRRPVNAWLEGEKRQDIFVVRRWHAQ